MRLIKSFLAVAVLMSAGIFAALGAGTVAHAQADYIPAVFKPDKIMFIKELPEVPAIERVAVMQCAADLKARSTTAHDVAYEVNNQIGQPYRLAVTAYKMIDPHIPRTC